MSRTSPKPMTLLRATLSAIARLEARGEKPARLTDPKLERWGAFKRRLGWWDLIDLLHADAALQYPVPFDFKRWPAPPTRLSERKAEFLIREIIAEPPQAEPMDWLRAQASALGLPGGALSQAPKLDSSHQVLGLPGTGGRVAAFQSFREERIDLIDQFTWLIEDNADFISIGLAAVETKRPIDPARLTKEPPQRRFDRVIGLKAHREAQAPRFEAISEKIKWI